MTLHRPGSLVNLRRSRSTSFLPFYRSQTNCTGTLKWIARSRKPENSAYYRSQCVDYTHYDDFLDEAEDLCYLPQLDGEGSQPRHVPEPPLEYLHSPRVNPFVRRDSSERPFARHEVKSNALNGQDRVNPGKQSMQNNDQELLVGSTILDKGSKAEVQHGSEDSHNDFPSGYATPSSSFGADERALMPMAEYPTSDRKASSTLHAPATNADCVGRIFGPPSLKEHVHLRHVGKPGTVLSPSSSTSSLKETVRLRHADIKSPVSPGPSSSGQEVRLRHADIPAPKYSGPSHMDQDIHLRLMDNPIHRSPGSPRLDQETPLRRIDRPTPASPSLSPVDQEVLLRHADFPTPTSPIPSRLNNIHLRRLDSSSPSAPSSSIDRLVNLQFDKEVTPSPGQQTRADGNIELRRVSQSVLKRRDSTQVTDQVRLRPIGSPIRERDESPGIERQASLAHVSKSIEQFERSSQDSTQIPMPNRQRARALSVGSTRGPEFESLESLLKGQVLPPLERSESMLYYADKCQRNDRSPTAEQAKEQPSVNERHSPQEPDRPPAIAALVPATFDVVAIATPTSEQPPVSERPSTLEPQQPRAAAPSVYGTPDLITSATPVEGQPITNGKPAISGLEKLPVLEPGNSPSPELEQPPISEPPVPEVEKPPVAIADLVQNVPNTIAFVAMAEKQVQANGKSPMIAPEKPLAVIATVPSTLVRTGFDTDSIAPTVVDRPMLNEPPTNQEQDKALGTTTPARATPNTVTNARPVPDATVVENQSEASSLQASQKAKRIAAIRKPATRAVPIVAGSFLTVPKISSPEFGDGQEDLDLSASVSSSVKPLTRYLPARLSDYVGDLSDESSHGDAANPNERGRLRTLSAFRLEALPSKSGENALQNQPQQSSSAPADPISSDPGNQEQVQNKSTGSDSGSFVHPLLDLESAKADAIRAEKSAYLDLPDESPMDNGSNHGDSSGPTHESDDIENAYIRSLLHPDEDGRSMDGAYRSDAGSNPPSEENFHTATKAIQNRTHHALGEKIESMPEMMEFIDSAAVEMGLDLRSGQLDGTRRDELTGDYTSGTLLKSSYEG